MIFRRDTKPVKDAKALLAAIVLRDDSRWGDVSRWQWKLAEWAFDERARPNRWESRPRGGSKSTDVSAIAMVAMLTTLPAGSQLDVYAADQDQARLVVDWARGLAARTPALAATLTIDAYKITAPNRQRSRILGGRKLLRLWPVAGDPGSG